MHGTRTEDHDIDVTRLCLDFQHALEKQVTEQAAHDARSPFLRKQAQKSMEITARLSTLKILQCIGQDVRRREGAIRPQQASRSRLAYRRLDTERHEAILAAGRKKQGREEGNFQPSCGARTWTGNERPPSPHGQNNAETGPATDHLIIGLSRFLQRITLDHRAHTR